MSLLLIRRYHGRYASNSIGYSCYSCSYCVYCTGSAMSNVPGSKKNVETLRAIAGLTEAQAIKMSGADLMQAALNVRVGLPVGASTGGSTLALLTKANPVIPT